MEAANTPKTTAKWLTWAREFLTFLASLPIPLTKSMEDVGPEDVLAFIDALWSKEHAASFLRGQNRLVASPQGVNGALNFLRTTYDMLGRRGTHHTSSRTGNPCESEAVHRYSQGYQRSMWTMGFQETYVGPLTRAKIEAVGK